MIAQAGERNKTTMEVDNKKGDGVRGYAMNKEQAQQAQKKELSFRKDFQSLKVLR